MKRFFTTLRNIFSIDELRGRIYNTLFYLLIFRVGCHIVLPGVDANVITASKDGESNGPLGLLNTILGGAFENASIFALGIMPYISASIVVQLLGAAVPYFQKMQKEGESGQRRSNAITRLLTVGLALAQSVAYLNTTIPAGAIKGDPVFFQISSMLIITGGTMFCMWLGERITEKGIGNGISMLIMIGIVSRFPAALVNEGRFSLTRPGGVFIFLLELIALFFVVMAVVMITQAVRRIPVQYARQVVGSKVYGGQRQYLPLKLNAAGVMPIIFAQSLMFIPALIAGLFRDENSTAAGIVATFTDYTTWQYSLVFGVLIILFTFFYTALTVDPKRISDEMKRNNGFIPGVKPGEQTAEYIDTIVSRITLPGALFLVALAITPALAFRLGVSKEFAQFYGGTSLLIMVGVVLDTLQQIESYLLMRKYEGLMQSGRIQGRTTNVAVA